jgi:hypothetical protein
VPRRSKYEWENTNKNEKKQAINQGKNKNRKGKRRTKQERTKEAKQKDRNP